MSARTTGTLLALAAATGFGAMAVLATAAYTGGADVHGLLLVRFLAAAAVLLPLAAWRGVLPGGRDLALLAAMGGVGYVTQSLAYFGAVALAPAGLVGILFGTYPVLVALADAARHRRRPTPATLLMAALAAAGGALVAGPVLSGNPAGAALALTAALVYTAYIVAGEGPSARVDPLGAAAVISTSAAVVYLAATPFHPPALPTTPLAWTSVLTIALASTVAAVLAFFAALRRLGPSRTATISAFEPVVTVLLAASFFGETFTGTQWTGAALVVTVVALVASGRLDRPAGTPVAEVGERVR